MKSSKPLKGVVHVYEIKKKKSSSQVFWNLNEKHKIYINAYCMEHWALWLCHAFEYIKDKLWSTDVSQLNISLD